MLRNVSYYLIFGKPLIMYVGILTLLSFLFTALIGFLNFKGNRTIPFRWHSRMAVLSITLAFIHGVLGILLYF
jgi:hypothetical protein